MIILPSSSTVQEVQEAGRFIALPVFEGKVKCLCAYFVIPLGVLRPHKLSTYIATKYSTGTVLQRVE